MLTCERVIHDSETGRTSLIDADDPVAYQELIFQLANVVFDRPGYYDLQLWANQELLGSTALLVELE